MKTKKRLEAVEVVLEAIINLLHKSDIIHKEDIQKEILGESDNPIERQF